jgi:hypothetical protein
MANPQHIEWLLEGVDAWNARRERDSFTPNFHNADIRAAFFHAGFVNSHERINLIGINFMYADLRNAYLGRANLTGAILIDAKLQNSRLMAADLTLANLSGAKLMNANLNEVVLRGAHLHLADVSGAVLGDADLRYYWKKSSSAEEELKATDLQLTSGLTEAQLSITKGTKGLWSTVLPKGIIAPTHWDEEPLLIDPTIKKDEPDNSAERARPWHLKAKTKLAPITPIADVEWTETGQLDVRHLTPFTPKPRKPIPIPSPEALAELKRGLIALSKQLRAQLAASASPNAAPFIGDARPLFKAIENQLALPDDEIIPIIVKINIDALERLGPSAEALADTEEVVFNAFIEQGRALLDLIPILKIIEDPYNEETIQDDKVDQATALLAEIDDVANSEITVAAIGPKLGGVSIESDAFPWRSEKQRIANKTSMWAGVLDKLEKPPKAIQGLNTYTGALGPLIAMIITLLNLLFG